ncbi:MAG: hypothetical protein AAF330_01180 [Pseudomonadota bacterium]
MTDRPDHKHIPLGSDALDALFAEAAEAEQGVPSGAALARWVAEAEAAADGYAERLVPVPRGSLLQELARALGGWRGGLGFATLAAAGLVVGLYPPVALDLLIASLAGSDAISIDLVAGFDTLTMWES